MKRAILYVHGKGGSAGEADRFRAVCPGFDVLGVDYQGELPWEAAPQIAAAYDEARRQYEHITLLANSIGAYFAMLALGDRASDRALFVSPVLDMERLILDMMGWAGVSEQALREQGEIPVNLLPIWFFWDTYYDFALASGMEQSYIDSYVRYYTSPGWLAFILLFTTLMGFLGCMVGSRLIRRHFKKAGVL